MADGGDLAARALRRLRGTSLSVLVFGPGERSPGGAARSAILECLRSTWPGAEVAFPEAVISANPDLKALLDRAGPYAAEALLVEESDGVVVLLVDHPDVTGSLGEQLQFLARPQLRHKFATLEPVRFAQAADWPSPPYILQFLSRLEESQRYVYEAEELDDVAAICEYLRQWLDGIAWAKWSRGC